MCTFDGINRAYSNRAIRELIRPRIIFQRHTRPQGDHYPCVNVPSFDFNVSARWKLYDSSFASDFMRVTVASLSYRFVNDRFHPASSLRRKEANYLARETIVTSAFVPFIRTLQYITIIIDCNEHFYCRPSLKRNDLIENSPKHLISD